MAPGPKCQTAGDQRPLQPRRWPLWRCELGCAPYLTLLTGGAKDASVVSARRSYVTAQIRVSPCLTLDISIFSPCWKSCVIRRLPASCETGLLGRVRHQSVRVAFC